MTVWEYYPELTSDSDSRSISNYSLLSQCLSSKNCNCNQLSQHNLTNNASVAAIEICSNASKLRLRLTLFHPDHRSVCWSSGPKNCPPPVLTQGQVSNIKSDDPDTCRAQVDKILCQIQEFNIHIENTLNVLQSGHGMDECSVNSTCQTCKVKFQFVFLHQSQIISKKPKSSFEGKQNKEYSIIFVRTHLHV